MGPFLPPSGHTTHCGVPEAPPASFNSSRLWLPWCCHTVQAHAMTVEGTSEGTSSWIHEAQALWLSPWLSQPPRRQRQEGRGGRALRTPWDPSLTLSASSPPPASRLQGSLHYSLLSAEPQRPRSPCQPPAPKTPWAVRNAVFPPWPPISHPLRSSFFLLTHLTSYTFHLFYFFNPISSHQRYKLHVGQNLLCLAHCWVLCASD